MSWWNGDGIFVVFIFENGVIFRFSLWNFVFFRCSVSCVNRYFIVYGEVFGRWCIMLIVVLVLRLVVMNVMNVIGLLVCCISIIDCVVR